MRGLLARWYLRISKFLPHMKLEYKPSAANVVADALSRAPTDGEIVKDKHFVTYYRGVVYLVYS